MLILFQHLVKKNTTAVSRTGMVTALIEWVPCKYAIIVLDQGSLPSERITTDTHTGEKIQEARD